jgi:lipopolysaccharide transport system ATP-binding protein
MPEIAIRLNELSKQYKLGGDTARYKSMRDVVTNVMKAPLRAFRRGGNGREQSETLWALHNVSCEIKSGELVGIIGRNGAGKSTMLKILSRITEPTSGTAEIHGRVGSLLEVGTGFHPELTGRENVFLNGAILGMRRGEILRKFDEIVEFAELSRFIDTTVKHYSSGMYMRLAFAVAAHLEPEILLVDEVLAVGDTAFQKKCLTKMQTVGQEGRTVLFVSHNMAAITRLCDRVILLQEGNIVQDGPADQVAASYLNLGLETRAIREWPEAAKAPSGSISVLRGIKIRDEIGNVAPSVDIRRPVGIEMEFEVTEGGHVLVPHHLVTNGEGVVMFQVNDLDPEWRLRPRPAGRYVSTAWIPGNFLSEGTAIVSCALCAFHPYIHQFYEREAVCFTVIDSTDGDSARGDWAGSFSGVVRPAVKWTTKFIPATNGYDIPAPLSSGLVVSLVTEPNTPESPQPEQPLDGLINSNTRDI